MSADRAFQQSPAPPVRWHGRWRSRHSHSSHCDGHMRQGRGGRGVLGRIVCPTNTAWPECVISIRQVGLGARWWRVRGRRGSPRRAAGHDEQDPTARSRRWRLLDRRRDGAILHLSRSRTCWGRARRLRRRARRRLSRRGTILWAAARVVRLL